MKTMKHLMMAVLALVGTVMTGCSEYEDVTATDSPKKTATYTTTIGFDDNSTTRALSATGVKTFVPGDKIAVFYQTEEGNFKIAKSEALEADDIHNEGRRADFTVTLKDPMQEGNVEYVYPASMVNSDWQLNYDALDTQDGTLATIGRDLDLAIFQGKLTSEGKLPATATLENYFALLEISILNADASYDITKYTTSLTISDGVDTYTVTPPAPATTFGDGPIYVLINPCVALETLSFTTDGGVTKNVTGHELKKGHMYPIGLRVGEVVNLSDQAETDGDGIKHFVAHHGDVLIGWYDGYVSIADGATVTLSDARVQTEGACHHPVLGCLGDGTILLSDFTDGNLLQVGHSNVASGIYVPKGKTLIIGGEGSLYIDAKNSNGAAIGGACDPEANKGTDCGTIIIEGGIIDLEAGYQSAGIGSGARASCDGIIIRGGIIKEACGGDRAAGIGCGNGGTCGDILISAGKIGGEFENWFYNGAMGGDFAAGIGTGEEGTCGNITIGPDITYVVACGGDNADNAIGLGCFGHGTCGTITVDAELEDTYENNLRRVIHP